MFGDCGAPDDEIAKLLGHEYKCPYRVLWNTINQDSPIAVCVVSLSGQWLVPHPRISEWLGYSMAELQGMTFQDITHPDDLEADLAEAQALIRREKRYYQMEKRYISKSGETVWVRLSGTALPSDDQARVIGFLSQIENISDRKAQEQQLRLLALTDPLTGLGNRRHLDLDLEKNWRVFQHNRTPFCLIMIDFDDFKVINSVYLHPGGDAVLKDAARKLRRIVRIEDSVFRATNGDEFAVVMPDTADIESAVSRLEECLCSSVEHEGQKIAYSCTVGGAVCNKQAKSIQDLCRLADADMMRRKQNKKALHRNRSASKI